MALELEELEELPPDGPPLRDTHVFVEASQANGSQQWPVALQSAPREEGLPAGQVEEAEGLAVAPELEGLGGIPPGETPFRDTQRFVEASQANGEQHWPVALQSAPRDEGFPDRQVSVAEDNTELEVVVASSDAMGLLAMELEFEQTEAEAEVKTLVTSVLVGHAQLMMVEVVVVRTVTTSAVETEMNVRAQARSLEIEECIFRASDTTK